MLAIYSANTAQPKSLLFQASWDYPFYHLSWLYIPWHIPIIFILLCMYVYIYVYIISLHITLHEKSSISMGCNCHGYVTNNQRVRFYWPTTNPAYGYSKSHRSKAWKFHCHWEASPVRGGRPRHGDGVKLVYLGIIWLNFVKQHMAHRKVKWFERHCSLLDWSFWVYCAPFMGKTM